ncbi:DUF6765 family protein [Spirochaeta lutea]|uniref:Uncharacterized protein n=1 Tax=Spirochaeta lutea TaxID=1480694 RepID=A0A098R535_9SPIO|nr:DUF6765 family protein [Spirochaeta lutea]KGE73827.1 hypothetical protein DC28_01015 [Spirochaeta lutea]
MNGIFHYSTTYLLALRAGFSATDAQILAYAANYVDHNLVPLQIRLPSGQVYRTIPTHHFGFWDPSQESSVWLPFHFFPSGDQACRESFRGDSKARSSNQAALNTLPSGAPVKELLIQALKTRNLYRIGIALHTFADSWAHQEFTGRNQPWNTLESLSPVPPIGHAQAGRNPDAYHTIWYDPRLTPEHRIILNRRRFIAAARKIYRYLAAYNHRSLDNTDLVIMELEQILGPQNFSASYEDYFWEKTDETRRSKPYSLQGLAWKAARQFGFSGPLPPAQHLGKTDEELELDFSLALNLAPYHRQEWKSQAVELPDAPLLDDQQQRRSDTYLWLKHELGVKQNLLEPQVVTAKPNFEHSHYYAWMEAAKEQAREAEGIIANTV